MAELIKEFEPEIETISLIPSDGGRFEVNLNAHPIFSKLQTRRHPERGEIAGIIEKHLKEGL